MDAGIPMDIRIESEILLSGQPRGVGRAPFSDCGRSTVCHTDPGAASPGAAHTHLGAAGSFPEVDGRSPGMTDAFQGANRPRLGMGGPSLGGDVPFLSGNRPSRGTTEPSPGADELSPGTDEPFPGGNGRRRGRNHVFGTASGVFVFGPGGSAGGRVFRTNGVPKSGNDAEAGKPRGRRKTQSAQMNLLAGLKATEQMAESGRRANL